MVQQGGASDESVQERQPEDVVQATEAELVADQPPEQVQRERLAITAESYSGPLPHPDHLRHFEATLPGAADRIIKMAEKQSAHRREMEALTVKSRLKAESRAQWLAAGITLSIVGGWLVRRFSRAHTCRSEPGDRCRHSNSGCVYLRKTNEAGARVRRRQERNNRRCLRLRDSKV